MSSSSIDSLSRLIQYTFYQSYTLKRFLITVTVIQIGTLNSNQDSNLFIAVYVVVTIICKGIEETYFFDCLEHTKII